MSIEIPSIRVLHKTGWQLYSITGIAPRYPKIGEQISLNGCKYRVLDVQHHIDGVLTPSACIHVIVGDDSSNISE
jgi:hypothetical protein